MSNASTRKSPKPLAAETRPHSRLSAVLALEASRLLKETPLSEAAEILQQLAGAREEGDGHLIWQHCMPSAEAAVANPQAGPSWETTTRSSRIVRTLRKDSFVVPFGHFSNLRSNDKLNIRSKNAI